MKKIQFNHPLAITINNTCNLTCNNCATAQCYNFKGVYRWENEADYYIKWSSLIDVANIDILGGEPYLNPDLLKWCINIKNLFSKSNVKVISNGTLLFLEKNIDITRQFLDHGVNLLVCTHSASDYFNHKQSIIKILEPYKDQIEIIPDLQNNLVKYMLNGRDIIIHELVDKMFQNYIKEVKDGVIYLSDGDPVKSHKNCIWATQCFNLQQGLLYKCPLVSNYAAAKTQVKYEERAINLLEQYKACSPFDEFENIQSFIDNLTKVIPQCSLCPYDKNPQEKVYPVTFDKSWKKAFRGVN